MRQRDGHPAWLPIGWSGTSVQGFVDIAPSPWGEAGQLLSFSGEAGPPTVIAPGFCATVLAVLDACDRGSAVWDGWQFIRATDRAPLETYGSWLQS